MILFPGMIAEAAKQAGMKVPADPDNDFNPDEFPHFDMFCTVQLGRSLLSWGEHWGNAQVVAAVPEDKLRETTLENLIALGLEGAF